MISYKITPYERAFTFQILSQDKVVGKAIESIGGLFYTRNGWKASVKNSPEVKVVSKQLFLRGKNSANDMRIDRTWNFKSNRERDNAIASLNSALLDVIEFAREYDNSRYFTADVDNATFFVDDVWEEATFIDDYGIWYYNHAPEARLMVRNSNPVKIDANGWGNNKLEGKPTIYVTY